MKRLLHAGLSAMAMMAASVAVAAEASFARWADNLAAEWMRLHPESATITQFFPAEEQDAVDRELALVGPALAEREIALARRGLVELRQRDGAALTAEEATSARLLEWQLENIVAQEPYVAHAFVFQQFRGLQVRLVNFLSQQHPIRRQADVANYLIRLGRVAARLDEGAVATEAAARAGIRPPRFILERTIQQMEGFLAPAPRDNVLVASLAERMAAAALPAKEQGAAVAEAERLVREEIRPAFERVVALLRAQLPDAPTAAGLAHLPQGSGAYAYALRTHTTTELTADEIHAIGLREVARIEAQMDTIFQELGYSTGTVSERYTQLNLALQPPAEPDPRPAILAQFTAIIREAEVRAETVFDLRPRAPVEVRREPLFTEKTAAARYSLPAPDGSRPGIFWAPLPGPVFRILDMRTLAYHEAVPGHHFQVALQQEMESLPRFRRDRVFGGLAVFAEGWALYSESLVDELGWYEGDAHGRLGYLNAQLFRARRLVVDTGLHAQGWTREQAIAYGLPPHEVERYVVYPGQACSYMIGQLRLLELRARAEQALGAGFSLREFHNLLLRQGTLPLEVLEAVVERWIEEQRRV